MTASSGIRSADRREILRLAIPALGALAADPLVSLVDTGFVARLGTIPLAALGVDAAIFGLAFVAFNFLQYGVTPLIGRARGRGDQDAIDRGARHALLLGLGIGLATTTVILVAAPTLLGWMSTPAEVVPDALVYLRIRALSGPAVMMIMVGHGLFRGLQDTRTPLVITLGFNVINLVLDALFIFGMGMGIGGAAWASVVAQVAGAVWFLVVIQRVGNGLIGRIDPAELLSLLRVGLDLVVRTASLVFTITFAARVAAAMGAAVVAAHQVAAQVFLTLGLAIDGLAIAGQAMVSVRLGADDRAGADRVGRRLLTWGAVTGIVFGVGLWFGRPAIAGLFALDPTTHAAVEVFLGWVAVLLVPGSLVFVWDGLFLGAGRFRFLAVTTLVAGVLATLYLAALPAFPFGIGMHQVWAGVLLLILLRGVPQAVSYVRAGASVSTE